MGKTATIIVVALVFYFVGAKFPFIAAKVGLA